LRRVSDIRTIPVCCLSLLFLPCNILCRPEATQTPPEMPPRIGKQPIPISTPAPSLQTHCRSCLRRHFSSTPSTQTKLRREMFSWLNGPGENFRTPLPGSTNYLSAYDRRGKLLRQVEGDGTKSSGTETPDSKALEAAATSPTLEKENRQDLRPFPLNTHFISQSVLSEELRQEIWKRVKVDGKSVRTVSVELGVEMRRVGAVVRLVEVEKRMRAEVCPIFSRSPISRSAFVMNNQIRLVFQTSIMVIPKKQITTL